MHSTWIVVIIIIANIVHPSVLWRWYVGDSKDIRPVKSSGPAVPESSLLKILLNLE